MNRHFSAIAAVAVAVALSATPALAADLLPLQRGFYVATDTACGEASDATIILYNGTSFGAAHAQCRKWSSHKQPDGTYQVTRSCRTIDGNRSRREKTTSSYELFSHTEFAETNQFGKFTFRHCRQSQLPSDWRVVNLGKNGGE